MRCTSRSLVLRQAQHRRPVEVLEPSVIYEAKDGKYGEDMDMTEKMPPVHRLAFEYMLGKVVGNGRYGKLFNNAFVDMANLCLVESGVKNAIFVTTDTEWVKLIRQNLSVDALAATRDFYDRFYMRP